MNKKIEHTGNWYLPFSPDLKAAGILRYDPVEGTSLELLQPLIPQAEEQLYKKKYDIILGTTTDSIPVTLEECAIASGNINPDGVSSFIIRPSRVYVGSHFDLTEKIKFSKALVRYTHLDEWLGISGFKIYQNHEQNEVTVKYKVPGLAVPVTGARFNVDIVYNYEINTNAAFRKDLRLSQNSSMRFNYPSAIKIDEIMKDILSIAGFLTLAVNRQCHPVEITALFKGEEVKIIDSTIEIPLNVKPVSVYDTAFTYSDVKGRLPDLIKNWIEKYDTIEPVCSLFFSVYQNSKTPASYQYINYFTALEIYHRIALSPAASSLSADPPEKRLKDIMKKYGKLVSGFIPKIDDFAEEAVKVRNRILHIPGKGAETDMDDEDIYMLCEKLKYIVIICLLSEIGINKKIIEKNRLRAMRLYA